MILIRRESSFFVIHFENRVFAQFKTINTELFHVRARWIYHMAYIWRENSSDICART